MAEFVLRTEEARNYTHTIVDPTERRLTRAAHCRAVTFLLEDQEYQQDYEQYPFDMLMFVRTAHALFKNKELVRRIVNGSYQDVEDIEDIF